MKICERGMGWLQIINEEGDVRACSWNKDNYIGNILKDDWDTILNGKRMKEFQKPLLDGTYTNCLVDNCPFLVNDKMDEHMVEYEENIKYPRELWLAYEGKCNYNCTCCTSHMHMEDAKKNDYSENYRIIAEKLEPVLPNVKVISANGRGELFASVHLLDILSKWNPEHAEDCGALLETNGALFDESHWEKIKNLGKYNLSVAITVMSFDELTYQFLSGCKYPIEKIESSLRFVKSLREQGVINHLELATVLQEYNFREMPEFTRRCIEEFGADSVRIRPIRRGGRFPKAFQWFMDVRNPKHPYYEDYKKIMQDPIFKDPHVVLWSGDEDSDMGDYPGRESKLMGEARRIKRKIMKILK